MIGIYLFLSIIFLVFCKNQEQDMNSFASKENSLQEIYKPQAPIMGGPAGIIFMWTLTKRSLKHKPILWCLLGWQMLGIRMSILTMVFCTSGAKPSDWGFLLNQNGLLFFRVNNGIIVGCNGVPACRQTG